MRKRSRRLQVVGAVIVVFIVAVTAVALVVRDSPHPVAKKSTVEQQFDAHRAPTWIQVPSSNEPSTP